MAATRQKPTKVDRVPLTRQGDTPPTPRPRDEEGDNEPLMRVSGLRPKHPHIILELDTGAHKIELELLSRLPIAKQQALLHASNEYEGLMDQDFEAMAPTDRRAGEARLKELLDYQFDRVLLQPEGMSKAEFNRIKAGVDDYGRSQVIRAFMLAPLQQALAEQVRLSEQPPSESSENSTSET